MLICGRSRIAGDLSFEGKQQSDSFSAVELAEVVERLETLDPEATIYAERPFSADSRALVAIEPEDGSTPPEAAALDYFMEVDIALEAAEVSKTGTRLDRVLYYAENDAYLFD